MAGLDPRRLVGNPGAPAYTGPVLADQTSTIGGAVGRKVNTGFGGVTPIQAHGAGIPADLSGLHQEEIVRQPVVTLGAGAIPRADYGLQTPTDLAGLRADLIKRLVAKPPRGEE